MDYNTLLDLATDLGYELAMSGAETFRVEESIGRVLDSYGVHGETFAIPNYLIVTILTEDGTPITRMRRIGHHGNDLDSVEKFSGLSRALCNRKPDPEEGLRWLEKVRKMRITYSFLLQTLGSFLGAAGFGLFFGGNWLDSLSAGLCGILIGLVDRILDQVRTNQFFKTIAASYLMALLAFALGALGMSPNPDAATIGALMILVPGLLFTNAMRDIIYGDTNSGINRIVQVLLIAVAIALGAACAWNTAKLMWGTPVSAAGITYPIWAHCLFSFVGCIGFAILFNIHGPGVWVCALGGGVTWLVYLLVMEFGGGEIMANFWAALAASVYSETMARVRKYPAISYLVVSIFPLLPGAGIYYTMYHAVQSEMDLFASRGMLTAGIAGIMAVGILLGSTVFRAWTVWKNRKK